MKKTLGMIRAKARDWTKAVEAVQDSIELCKTVGDKGEEAEAWGNLARIHMGSEDLSAAMSAAQAQRDCYKESNEPTKEACAQLLIANIYGMQADLGTALS